MFQCFNVSILLHHLSYIQQKVISSSVNLRDISFPTFHHFILNIFFTQCFRNFCNPLCLCKCFLKHCVCISFCPCFYLFCFKFNSFKIILCSKSLLFSSYFCFYGLIKLCAKSKVFYVYIRNSNMGFL